MLWHEEEKHKTQERAPAQHKTKEYPGQKFRSFLTMPFDWIHSFFFFFFIIFGFSFCSRFFIDGIGIGIVCLPFSTIFMSVFMALSVSQLNYTFSSTHNAHTLNHRVSITIVRRRRVIVFTLALLAWISFVLDFFRRRCECVYVCPSHLNHIAIMFSDVMLCFVCVEWSYEIENTNRCKMDAVRHQFDSFIPHDIELRALCGLDKMIIVPISI